MSRPTYRHEPDVPLVGLQMRLARRHPGLEVAACLGTFGDDDRPCQRIVFRGTPTELAAAGLLLGFTATRRRVRTSTGGWRVRITNGATVMVMAVEFLADQGKVPVRAQRAAGAIMARLTKARPTDRLRRSPEDERRLDAQRVLLFVQQDARRLAELSAWVFEEVPPARLVAMHARAWREATGTEPPAVATLWELVMQPIPRLPD